MGRLSHLAQFLSGDVGSPRPPTTASAPHIRDAMSSRRVMGVVLVALLPSVLIGIYRTGLLESAAIATAGATAETGWRAAVMLWLGLGFDPQHPMVALVFGLLWFLPLFAVVTLAGYFWQGVFAALRRRDPGDGLMVVAVIFTLCLPAKMPLWQAALGMSFAIVFGREIFGGMGRNFLNPALAGLALLYVSYPSSMVSETMWWVIDGFSGATAVGGIPEAGMKAVAWMGTSWMQAFVGIAPGSMGNGSMLASVIGAAILLYYRVASGRIMFAVFAGMLITSLLFNAFAADGAAYAALTWRWHLVMGAFAFGAVFLATDPVTASVTPAGRWIYGVLVGVLVVLIRVANHAHPDGVIFAVLLGNIFAPLIDYLVVRTYIRKRRRRYG